MGPVLGLFVVIVFAFKERTCLISPIKSTITTSSVQDSILNIIFIGDSWAEKAKEYHMPYKLDSILYSNNIISKTKALGEHGATSRDIYFNLYSVNDIFNPKPDIAIISCGVNDSHGQYGSEFYAHHTVLLLKALLDLNIKPVLIELPNYEISEQYNYYPYYKRFAYKTLSYFTDCSWNINNITRYRKSLNQMILQQNMDEQISLLSIDSFPSMYYCDHMHLNSLGYSRLSEIIAKEIIISCYH